jgi:AcrR family transcriptional regulator
MVRKTVFTRDDVISAGMAVIEQDGLAGLSARRVAEELGASTAPVYSNFANMEQLAVAVKQAVTDLLLDFTTRHFTDDAFLNIGIGILEFARQKPSLYGAIFMQDTTQCQAGPRVMARLTERMASLDGLSELPESERVMLLHQMGIFTHGLAVRICSGLTEGYSFEDLVILLKDAGEAMTCHALSRPERNAEQQALIQALIAYNTKDKPGND